MWLACGWHSRREHPPTEDGEEAAYEQWEREHAVVELARQATRHRQDLAQVLAWLGGQAGRLHDPRHLRLGHPWPRSCAPAVTDVRRDRERQASDR